MTLRKINARDIILEVEDSTPLTWIELGGLNSVVPNRAENEEVAETTTYASEGEYEQEVMQRGASLTAEGFELKDDITGALDPGQARCEELGTLKGVASVGRIRFRYPVDPEWRVWNCTVSIGEGGGGNNDKGAWSCTFTKSGATTTEAVTP